MKRVHSTSHDTATDTDSGTRCSVSRPKRRAVSTKTVDKWILEHDKTLNTSTWLEYEVENRYHAEMQDLCTV